MIGERIKRLRIGAGMTQQELSVKLGISPSSVGMYEQNRRVPPNDILLRLCEIFQVTSDWMLAGDEHTFRQNSMYNEHKEDLTSVLENLKNQLIQQEGLMFHGQVLQDDDIEKIFEAMKLGAEIAVSKRNK